MTHMVRDGWSSCLRHYEALRTKIARPLQEITSGSQIQPTAKKYGKSRFYSSIKSGALFLVSLIIDASIKIRLN